MKLLGRCDIQQCGWLPPGLAISLLVICRQPALVQQGLHQQTQQPGGAVSVLGWLEAIMLPHRRRYHHPVAEGVDQRRHSSPARTVRWRNHLQAKCSQALHRLRDNLLWARTGQMQPAHYGVEWCIRKRRPAMSQDVDDPGMRTGCEHHQPHRVVLQPRLRQG